MYCPNCSQEQVSDEMRFCSRCGFLLSGVRELVVTGGAPVVRGTDAQLEQLSCSQRGVRRGAGMMLASLVLALVVALLSAIDDGFAVLGLVPFLCFVIGFGLVVYGAFLAKKRAPRAIDVASQRHVAPLMAGQSGAPARTPELSPPRFAPIERITAKRTETAEMVQPPSVTENTTRLLDEEVEPRRG